MLANGQPDPDQRPRLRALLGDCEARPFHQQVVQSAWSPVLDVEELHQPVKNAIRHVLENCGNPGDVPRCLTVSGQFGYGKTHLLAWTRQLLEPLSDSLFVLVPPYSPEQGSLERHMLRATIDALWLRSTAKGDQLREVVRERLVASYDSLAHGRAQLKELKAGTSWRRWVAPASLRIGRRVVADQLKALGKAFERPFLLERAFESFAREHAPVSDNVRPDRDVFAAACFVACGNTDQRWRAEQWMRNEPIPLAVFESLHIRHLCDDQGKILNVLFTLSRLLGRRFCFAFDQMEDTYRELQRHNQKGEDLWGRTASLLRTIATIPRFCLLFMFQTVTWSDFVRSAPKWLLDRMTEGYGTQELPPLTDPVACALVRARMEHLVWASLPGESPPADSPLFPFSEAGVHQLRIEAGSELRRFLQLAQARYEELVGVRPPSRRVELIRLDPAEVIAHEARSIRIHGRNLPAVPNLSFSGRPVVPVACDPQAGWIDVTTPVGLTGEVEVRVWESDNPDNHAAMTLRFVERPLPPSPYHKHVDRKRFRKRRNDLKLTQLQVAQRLGTTATFVSAFETEKNKPPDEWLVKLADLYDRTLADFLK